MVCMVYACCTWIDIGMQVHGVGLCLLFMLVILGLKCINISRLGLASWDT
jgi:hypothetical protein